MLSMDYLVLDGGGIRTKLASFAHPDLGYAIIASLGGTGGLRIPCPIRVHA